MDADEELPPLDPAYASAPPADPAALDIAFPPQLCDECGRSLDVDVAGSDGLTLVLLCLEHGPQGLIEPFIR